jgi:hypothetical protein
MMPPIGQISQPHIKKTHWGLCMGVGGSPEGWSGGGDKRKPEVYVGNARKVSPPFIPLRLAYGALNGLGGEAILWRDFTATW